MRRLHWDIALRQAYDPGHGLSAFLSRLSVFGMVIAISLLLAALSVMNGFEREMRVRILNLVPHVTIRGFAAADDWTQVQTNMAQLESVKDSTALQTSMLYWLLRAMRTLLA